MKARVIVTLKSGVLDPQGKAIEGALKGLAIDGLKTVRQGKIFDIELEGEDRAAARPEAGGGLRAAARQYDRRELRDRNRLRAHARGGDPLSWRQSRRRRRARAQAGERRRRPRSSGTPSTSCRPGVDLVVLPGGFSYGDYLRCGAIAARAADHAGGRRPRRARRAGARHLQRLPDPVRGGPAAGRADAQRPTPIHVQDAARAGRERANARSLAATRPDRWSSSPSPTARAISSPTRRRSSKSRRRAGSRSATATPRDGSEIDQPQWLDKFHSRRVQRAVQRARADAAPGKPDRSAGRRQSTAARFSLPLRHEGRRPSVRRRRRAVHTNPQALRKKFIDCRLFVIVRERLFVII